MMHTHIALYSTRLSLNICNVLLHGTGSYLLKCQYRLGRKSPQKVFIINLSICELLMNLLETLRSIPRALEVSPKTKLLIDGVQNYVLITMFTGVSFIFYLDMFYITLDRLLSVLLNFRYKFYCTENRARNLMSATWCMGVLITICISLAHRFVKYDWKPSFFTYVYPILEFTFILIAIATYLFIFKQYKDSCRKNTRIWRRKTGYNGKVTSIRLFQNSRFFVPLLLIATFIVFMVIPDLVYLFHGILCNNISESLLAACWISYSISNLADAWIYIFMQKSVLRLLKIKLRNACCCCWRQIQDGRISRWRVKRGRLNVKCNYKIATVCKGSISKTSLHTESESL